MEAEEKPELEQVAVDDTDETGGTHDSESAFPGDIGKVADKYVIDFFQQISMIDAGDEANLACSFLAPRMILAEPNGLLGKTGCSILYHLPDRIPVEISRRCLKNALGEYIQHVDIYQDEEALQNPGHVAQYLPGIKKLYDKLSNGQPIAHPFLAVQSICPELRDLPAIAIGKKLTPDVGGFYVDEATSVPQFKNICIPTFQEILDVAEEYQIKEVKATWEEIQRVRELYLGGE